MFFISLTQVEIRSPNLKLIVLAHATDYYLPETQDTDSFIEFSININFPIFTVAMIVNYPV